MWWRNFVVLGDFFLLVSRNAGFEEFVLVLWKYDYLIIMYPDVRTILMSKFSLAAKRVVVVSAVVYEKKRTRVCIRCMFEGDVFGFRILNGITTRFCFECYDLTWDKQRCRSLTKTLMDRGLIVKAVCPCGNHNVQAHHDDYNHPMRVRWLCKRCHINHHKTAFLLKKQAV